MKNFLKTIYFNLDRYKIYKKILNKFLYVDTIINKLNRIKLSIIFIFILHVVLYFIKFKKVQKKFILKVMMKS